MGTITISGTPYLIYGTAALAKIYFAGNINSAVYDTASSADKNKALISGTRWLDRLGLIDPDTSVAIAPSDLDTNVPEAVKQANYELALVLLTEASAQDNATTGSNIKSVKGGSAEVQFFRASEGAVLSNVALSLVSKYLVGSQASSTAGNFASGTGECSSFPQTDLELYGRVKGF